MFNSQKVLNKRKQKLRKMIFLCLDLMEKGEEKTSIKERKGKFGEVHSSII